MKFIHLTDTHFVPAGGVLYGQSPRTGLVPAVQDINRYHSDAEFVVITGDLSHWGEKAAYEDLRAVLTELCVPCHLVLGNHDDRDNFAAVFPRTPRDPAGFVQYVLDTPVGVFVILDTLQPGKASGNLCRQRLAWLAEVLETHAERPVYLFMHHPPFEIGIESMDLIGFEDKEAFYQCVLQHRDIRQIFFGHVHRPIHGTWRGIGFSTQRGTNHQVDLVLAGADIPGTFEAPAYSVVLATPDQVTVHLRDYTDRSPRFSLRDGRALKAASLVELSALTRCDDTVAAIDL